MRTYMHPRLLRTYYTVLFVGCQSKGVFDWLQVPDVKKHMIGQLRDTHTFLIAPRATSFDCNMLANIRMTSWSCPSTLKKISSASRGTAIQVMTPSNHRDIFRTIWSSNSSRRETSGYPDTSCNTAHKHRADSAPASSNNGIGTIREPSTAALRNHWSLWKQVSLRKSSLSRTRAPRVAKEQLKSSAKHARAGNRGDMVPPKLIGSMNSLHERYTRNESETLGRNGKSWTPLGEPKF